MKVQEKLGKTGVIYGNTSDTPLNLFFFKVKDMFGGVFPYVSVLNVIIIHLRCIRDGHILCTCNLYHEIPNYCTSNYCISQYSNFEAFFFHIFPLLESNMFQFLLLNIPESTNTFITSCLPWHLGFWLWFWLGLRYLQQQQVAIEHMKTNQRLWRIRAEHVTIYTHYVRTYSECFSWFFFRLANPKD